MLIVSSFHDFYDVGMKNGVDKTCVYTRESKDIDNGWLRPYMYGPTDRWNASVLAFCGKYYPFLYRYVGSELEVIWSYAEALEKIPLTEKDRLWGDRSLSTKRGLAKFFQDAQYPEMDKLFYEHRTPVFGFLPFRRIWTRENKLHDGLTVNPSLKKVEFFKVKDPITAFQEIAMYMSGVIGAPPKQLVEISDKDMAASKGHDGEFSFRKPPGKRSKNGRWR